MALGYVLIIAEAGKEADVQDKLSKIQCVAEAYRLFGEYDFVVKVNADSSDKLAQVISDEIKTLEGIIKTDVFFAIKL